MATLLCIKEDVQDDPTSLKVFLEMIDPPERSILTKSGLFSHWSGENFQMNQSNLISFFSESYSHNVRIKWKELAVAFSNHLRSFF